MHGEIGGGHDPDGEVEGRLVGAQQMRAPNTNGSMYATTNSSGETAFATIGDTSSTRRGAARGASPECDACSDAQRRDTRRTDASLALSLSIGGFSLKNASSDALERKRRRNVQGQCL